MRHGKTVFFATDENREPTKGMLVNLTPRKKHVTVATTSKDQPVLVPLNYLREPPPLPLKDQTFVICRMFSPVRLAIKEIREALIKQLFLMAPSCVHMFSKAIN